MKRTIVLLLGLMFFLDTLSQDKIILKSQEVIACKVEKIGTDIISYKRYDNIYGPLYELSKSKVSAILYENGTADVFNVQELVEEDNYCNQSASNECKERIEGVVNVRGALKKGVGKSTLYLSRRETRDIISCCNNQMATYYWRYSKMENIGSVLNVGGIVLSSCGTACLISQIVESDNLSILGIGIGAISTGVSMLGIGIPLSIVGKNRKIRKVNEFEKVYLGKEFVKCSDNSILNLSYNKNLIGITLKF